MDTEDRGIAAWAGGEDWLEGANGGRRDICNTFNHKSVYLFVFKEYHLDSQIRQQFKAQVL